MRCCKFLILFGLVYSLRDCGVHTLLSTQLEEAAPPDGPVVWSVGVGCQPLCICKSLGNGSWMGAGSLFVCVLQSFSLGRTSLLPLLVSLMPLFLVALPAFFSGTFSAAHAAVSILWRRNSPDSHSSPLAFHFLILLFIVPAFACLAFTSTSVCNLHFTEGLSTTRQQKCCELLHERNL